MSATKNSPTASLLKRMPWGMNQNGPDLSAGPSHCWEEIFFYRMAALPSTAFADARRCVVLLIDPV